MPKMQCYSKQSVWSFTWTGKIIPLTLISIYNKILWFGSFWSTAFIYSRTFKPCSSVKKFCEFRKVSLKYQFCFESNASRNCICKRKISVSLTFCGRLNIGKGCTKWCCKLCKHHILSERCEKNGIKHCSWSIHRFCRSNALWVAHYVSRIFTFLILWLWRIDPDTHADISVYSEASLLIRACNQLGQFLTHKETNLR